MLRLQELKAGYGPILVLKGVSIEVGEGEIVTLIGSNGAGKTTTLHCASLLLPLISGQVEFEGRSILGLQAHELVSKGIAHVPEGRRVFGRMTVRENLELGAYCRKGKSHEAELKHIFSLFPVLDDRKTQLAGTLSGGEQQMLALGRALMSKPKLLLMDEPSMGVAPLLVAKIYEAVCKLNKEDGLTILLVEQNAQAALTLANRGYVIETGEITLSDNAQSLLSNPKVREAYLGEA